MTRRTAWLLTALLLACAGRPPVRTSAPAAPSSAPSSAPTSAGLAAETLPGDAPCPSEACTDPFAAWAGMFPVERGGIVILFDGGAAERANVRENIAGLGLEAVEMSEYGERFAAWVPGVECRKFDVVYAVAPSVTPRPLSWCFPPLMHEAAQAHCADGRIPQQRCAKYGF